MITIEEIEVIKNIVISSICKEYVLIKKDAEVQDEPATREDVIGEFEAKKKEFKDDVPKDISISFNPITNFVTTKVNGKFIK